MHNDYNTLKNSRFICAQVQKSYIDIVCADIGVHTTYLYLHVKFCYNTFLNYGYIRV